MLTSSRVSGLSVLLAPIGHVFIMISLIILAIAILVMMCYFIVTFVIVVV